MSGENFKVLINRGRVLYSNCCCLKLACLLILRLEMKKCRHGDGSSNEKQNDKGDNKVNSCQLQDISKSFKGSRMELCYIKILPAFFLLSPFSVCWGLVLGALE